MATLATSAGVDAASPDDGVGDRQWVVPAAALVLVQYVAAVLLSRSVGFSEQPPVVSYAVLAVIISLTGAIVIVLGRIWALWRQNESRPIERLWNEADIQAVACYFAGAQLIALQIGALTWLKVMLPWVVPYWADPALAAADRALLGTDAWRIVPVALMRALDLLYVTWAPVKLVTLLVILCLPPSARKSQAMLSYFLVFGLMGVTGQYVLSSAGPVFYDRIVGGDSFANLLARLNANAHFVQVGVSFLWTSYTHHNREFANGISAMPSMHVAIATWVALSLSSFWRKIRLLAWGWWAIIFIGSFALGWHYFVDSVVATVGALACWVGAQLILSRETAIRSSRPVPSS